MNQFKKFLLEAPVPSQMEQSLKDEIQKWQDEPTCLEILKTLDNAVYSSLCSDFTIKLMNVLLEEQIKKENTTYQELIKQATWRKI